MFSGVAHPMALATATARELLRRPGIALSCVAVGALILVLHDLSASAFDTSGQLALELVVSSITLYLAVVGGVAGVRVLSADDELGPAPELATTPVTPLEYVLARFVGVLMALAVLLLALLCFAALAQLRFAAGAHVEPPPLAIDLLALTLIGAFLHAAVFTALGCSLGAGTGPQLALILLAGAIVIARTVVPTLSDVTGGAAFLALLVPDPARLDLSHATGFSRPPGALAFAVACAGALLQTLGLIAVARWFLALRAR